MDAETSKAQLRARIRSERSSRAAAEADSTSASTLAGTAEGVVESLFPGDDLSGRSLLAYAALSGEPTLDPLIDHVLTRGATVFLPVVTKIGQPLMFGQVTGSMSTLKPQGRWGIREPAATMTAKDLLSAEVALDLMFVPALGFGPGGARLGNGGGFYDRTFGPQGLVPLTGDPREGPQVYGVCFDEELDLPGLVIEDWDLRISRVVTQLGIREYEK